MIMAKHTLTIFNSYEGEFVPPKPPPTFRQRTVLKYAQWEDITGINANQNGMAMVDKTISIIIPKDVKTTDGRKYIDPIPFELLPPDQKKYYWTINTTQGKATVMFLGEVPEYNGVFTETEAKQQFRNCTIKTVDNLTDQPVMPHFELTGI